MPLRDLFGRSRGRDRDPGSAGAPPPTDLAGALADLAAFSAERPELASAASGLARVLTAAFRDPAPEPAFAADALIQAAWAAGVPALRCGDVPVACDPGDLRARALAVTEALDASPARDALRDALRSGQADVSAWAASALDGDPDDLGGGPSALGLDAALCRAVVRLALLPPLARLSARLDALRPEGLWARGDCPVCGGPATLAEARGLEQRRVWRCGVCASGWPGDRLRCPACGESDHRRLHYLFAEGRADRERLDLCDTCGHRLPVVATLAPLTPPALLVAELACAPLDGDAGEEPPT